VADGGGGDVEALEVLEDGLLVLSLLLGGVGVVEPKQHLE